MKNIAVILAGGVGTRMGADVPKQFIEVLDKPIIVYTIEKFSIHKNIDEIFVVCHKDYVEYMLELKEKYDIKKLNSHIIVGGKTAQESIYNALFYLKNHMSNSDIVLFHESVRPLVSEEIITDAIEMAQKNGNGMSSYNPYESFIYSTNSVFSETTYPRHYLYGVMNPQSVRGDVLFDILNKGYHFEDDYVHSLYDVFARLGMTMYMSKGSVKNMKLTTTDDLNYFKYYLMTKEGK